jgi:hydroxylamine reductase (hybrid-cluster protein)
MADFERLVTAIERLEAMTEANNEKFEVLRGILVSWMDIHQARTEAMQQIMAEMKCQIDNPHLPD